MHTHTVIHFQGGFKTTYKSTEPSDLTAFILTTDLLSETRLDRTYTSNCQILLQNPTDRTLLGYLLEFFFFL